MIGIVTDAGRVNRLWWKGDPELLLVTHPDLISQAKLAGITSSRVRNIGLIAHPRLRSILPTVQGKESLGLSDTFTVLLACGGMGFGPNVDHCA